MKRNASPHLRRSRSIRDHPGIAGALTLALLVSVLTIAGAEAAPAPPTGLSGTVDLIDEYQGQTLCDPTPKAGTIALRDLLWRTYGPTIWAATSRDCNAAWDPGPSEHKDGRAVDWGVSVRTSTKAIGDEFFAWATANNGAMARRLGIMYIIWDSRMWRTYDMARGFSAYRSCMSAWTAASYDSTCHRDHMHISLTWHGAAAETSWYDGTAVTRGSCRAGAPVAVQTGSADSPSEIFNPTAGVGVQGGTGCYLGQRIQALKMPVDRPAVLRIRAVSVRANAPPGIRIWSNTGASQQLGASGTYPRDLLVPVASDGLIYLQAPVGQAQLRLQGVGRDHMIPAGGQVRVPVTGASRRASADAKAVALNVTVTGAQGAGYVTVYPCGTTRPLASVLNFTANQTVANAVVTRPGADGDVCVYSSASSDVIIDSMGYFPAGSSFTGMNPKRLLDTRVAAGPAAGVDVAVQVPAGAAGAALSLAVTNTSASGYVTVYPCGERLPKTSTMNFSAGQTLAGSVIAKAGTGGRICLRSNVATDIVVDQMGVIAPGGGYVARSPTRLIDTRAKSGPIPPLQELALPAQVPGTAATLNIAVTGSRSPGWIVSYPCGTPRPPTSTVNYQAAQTIANSALVKISTDGRVCLQASSATNVIVDLTGAFRGEADYRPITPLRLLDTRQS